jgi:hypothetical protein
MRVFLFAAVLGTALCPTDCLLAAYGSEIIPETTALRHGLARPWVTQIQVDRARGRVRDVVLYDGVIYVQTDRANIHAVDAETGQSLWAAQVGRPDHPSVTPGACDDLLATVNGSRLYVLNRYTGAVLQEVEVKGAPGGGVAMSRKRVYVPMVNGMIMAYRVEPLVDPLKELGKIDPDETPEKKKEREEERRQNIRLKQEYVPPMAYQSAGRTLVQPLVTFADSNEEFVTWTTDRGYLNLARIDRRSEDFLVLKWRLPTGESITASPSYLPRDPNVEDDVDRVFIGSRDGYVYALAERSGEKLWRFSAGEPIVEPTAAIEDRLYASTQLGGLYCLDAKTGKQQWFAPDILRFLAAGKDRVYAADRIGRMQILDAKTGGRVDVLETEALPVKVMNTQTDRVYLGTTTGLLQCLRAAEQVQPIHWGEGRRLRDEDEPPAKEPAKAIGKAKKVDDGADAGKAKKERAKPVAKPKKDDADADADAAAEDVKPKPKPKRTPKAKAKADDGGGDLGGDDAPPTGKAKRAVKKAVKGAKGKADDDAPVGGDDNPFGK